MDKLKKTLDEVAEDVIKGKYGNGDECFNKLLNEGYNPYQVLKRVNELLR